jgi:hypothetical protein
MENGGLEAEDGDTNQVLNLLKDPRRRPIEVDAREFRVLAEQLLVTEASGKQCHQKHNHVDTSPSGHPYPVVNGHHGGRSGSGRRKPNGYVVKNRSRSSDRVVDTEIQATLGSSLDKCQQKGHKVAEQYVASDNVDGDIGSRTLKRNRRSRRETFELESLQAGKSQQAASKKASTSCSTAASNTRHQHREASNPRTEYTSDEKEWLKEKLLEEFERQELMNKKSTSSGGRSKRKSQHSADSKPVSSPLAHQQQGSNAQEVARAEEGAPDKNQLTVTGRSGALCRDTIAEMTSGLVEHYFLRAIPMQPAGAAAKLPAVAANAVAALKSGGGGGNCAVSGGSSHHHHHQQQTASATRQKECCGGGVSSSTIDEVVTAAAVATTTTVFLSEQHHSTTTCKASFPSICDGVVAAAGRHNSSGQLDNMQSTSYSTSMTQLERGVCGVPPDASPVPARLSTTMPREKMVLLPEKTSPSLHASLPRPGRHSHSESCRESSVSMPGSPPPYVHPKSQEKDCSCPCDCRSSVYPSQEVRKEFRNFNLSKFNIF